MKSSVILKDESDKMALITRISQAEISKPVYVEFSFYKPKRSRDQNALMWSIYKQVQNHIYASQGNWFSSDEIHSFFKNKFLPTTTVEINGEAMEATKSTAALKVGEMQDYLEKLIIYCGNELGMIVEAG